LSGAWRPFHEHPHAASPPVPKGVTMSTIIEFADKLLSQVDIVRVVEEYVPLRRGGSNLKGLCPFHREKTPSFSVSPSKQMFHCFGCGVGGNAIAFVQRVERIEWMDALRLVAEKNGIQVPPLKRDHDQGRDDARQRFLEVNKMAMGHFCANLEAAMRNPSHEISAYLGRRKLDAATVRRFGIGLAADAWSAMMDAGRKAGFERETLVAAGVAIHNAESKRHYDRFRKRLIFPICDTLGRPIAFGGRVYASDAAPDEPKYVNSPETALYHKGQQLYALHLAKEAISTRGHALLMEGYMDVIRAHMHGFENAVASCGTALTEEQARSLKKYAPEVVFVYDGDAAGQKAMLRGAEILLDLEFRVRIVALPGNHDPDSYLLEHGAEAFRREIDSARPLIPFFLESARRRHNTASVEGRVEVAEFMLPLLRKVRNPIALREHIREVAQGIGIDETALQRRLRDRDGRGAEKMRAQVESAAAAAESRVERMLLKLAVESQSARPFLAGKMDPDWISDPAVRKWFRFCAAQDADQPIGWDYLIACCDDEGEAAFLRALALDDRDPLDDREKVMDHCVVRVQLHHRKREHEDLARKIHEYMQETGADLDGAKPIAQELDRGKSAMVDLGRKFFVGNNRPRQPRRH
jgi:DNA primase